MSKTRFVFALAALLPLVASATVVVQKSFEQMAASAPVIVRGTVGETAAKLGDRGRIETWTQLTVTEAFKGKTGATVMVRQPGGVVGKIGQSVAGAAQFRSGEDVLLFLEPSSDGSASFVVLGMAFGKVSFLPAITGELKAVRDARGLATYSQGTGELRPLNSVEDLGTADSFVQRIRRAVKAAAKGGAR